MKRLILDIETTPNKGYFWSAGWKKAIPHQNITNERAIICASYKWEGEKKIHTLISTAPKSTDRLLSLRNDKVLLKKLIPIMESADEIVGHNSDKFDINWIRTRAAYYDLVLSPDIKSIDTLKFAKSRFYFNSNSLEYIAKYLGVGQKMDTGGFGLWTASIKEGTKDAAILGSDYAMSKMVEYCQNDVELTEGVYQILSKQAPLKTHVGVMEGGVKSDCPKCGSSNTKRFRDTFTTAGTRQAQMQCLDCTRVFKCADTTAKNEGK